MPRSARTISDIGIYHVVARGNNKQIIFEDEADYRRFLGLLRECKHLYGIKILAWSLMENHVHLCVEDPDNNLADFMHRLLGCYAMYLNARHGRGGHLFQDRYFSDPIIDESQLLECVRYITNNCLYAGICSPEEYPWNSDHEYTDVPDIVSPEIVLGLLGGAQQYREFISSHTHCVYSFEGPGPLSSEEALRIARAVAASLGVHLSEIKALPVRKRNEAVRQLRRHGLSNRHIGRLCAISESTISRIVRG